ncbi:hypothetical protein Avbf_13019 [Armadillidium vulgare]|nr:hypothetical protein Avbf_13019 [Armadillidium vulgare]
MPSLLLMRVPKKDEDKKGNVHDCSPGMSPTVEVPLPRENGNGIHRGRERIRDWPQYASSPFNGIHQSGMEGRGSSLGAAGATGGMGIGPRGTPSIRVEPYGELPECFHIGHELQSQYPMEIRRAIQNVQFIHHHMVQQDRFDEEA